MERFVDPRTHAVDVQIGLVDNPHFVRYGPVKKIAEGSPMMFSGYHVASTAINSAMCAVLLIGCAAQPGGNWIGVNTPEDAGRLPSDYRDMVTNVLRSSLKDPYSAVITVGTAVQTQCEIGIYGAFHGWAVPVTYNAKNGYGAFTGERSVYYWIANGGVRRVSDSPSLCP